LLIGWTDADGHSNGDGFSQHPKCHTDFGDTSAADNSG
jgi:hypothetical protein